MKSKMKSLTLLMVGGCLLTMNVYAESNAISASVGGAVGAGGTSTVLLVDYEHAFTDNFALSGRVGHLSYSYSDEVYEEEGSGPGAQVSAKFYPSGNALHNFYFGVGLGLWKMTGEWTDDKDTRWPTSDSISTSNAEIHGELGWRLGDDIQFAPSLQVGTFLSTEAMLAQFISLNFGISFVF